MLIVVPVVQHIGKVQPTEGGAINDRNAADVPLSRAAEKLGFAEGDIRLSPCCKETPRSSSFQPTTRVDGSVCSWNLNASSLAHIYWVRSLQRPWDMRVSAPTGQISLSVCICN